jgi:CheY-like chemotaxis protein
MALRCLIVDDNADFIAAARDLLERQGVAVVGVASTSAEAVERVHEVQPDVALIDIDLGEETGLDVARRIADTTGIEHVPLVLISTYAQADFEDVVAASPAVGFLSKSTLSARAIEEMLNERRDTR